MNKVVITGATGMIGRTLIEYLLNKNIKVLAITRENSKKLNVLPNHKNLKVIECNLSNLSKLEQPENDYDTFYHLAWDGTFGNSRNDLDIQNKNIVYTIEAIHLAKRLGCKTFIGAGSQAEYGRVDGIIDENTKTNPENGYGIAKLKAGNLSRIEANKYNIKHIWTRIFSVYGPYDRDKTMIMSSIKHMLEGTSPDYTKGEQIWDYVYSEDVAKALYLIGKKGKNNAIYCIAQGKTKPLKEYIEILKNKIDNNIELKLGTIPYSDKQVMNLSVNINKLTKEIGFIPETSFEEGIEKTISWYKGSGKYEEN